MKRKTLVVVFMLAASPLLWAQSDDKRFEKILDEYYTIHSALAGDSVDGVGPAAEAIAGLAAAGKGEPWARIHKAARDFPKGSLEQARAGFFELSKPLLVYLNQSYAGGKRAYRYFCGMQQKAWIQNDSEVRNPYYGSSMLACGELIR